jgi:hypothetical protein
MVPCVGIVSKSNGTVIFLYLLKQNVFGKPIRSRTRRRSKNEERERGGGGFFLPLMLLRAEI